ncbi:MAG: TolC family outer membrane protein [Gammaproteobacteria bacterium]|nr:TolC family outer membrane protein [Gammaproteobacteria bacterium]
MSTAASAEGLQAIYEQARVADPVWLGAQAGNRAAQEATEQSFAAFLPSASLSADSTSNFQDSKSNNTRILDNREKYNSNAWNLNITQPVFRMANYATHRQAKASVRQADILLSSEAQNLILRVAEAYFDVLSAASDLTAVRAEKKAIARQLDQAQKRFEVGLIAITDVHEAQAGYDLAQANEIAAVNRLFTARVALAEITGKNYKKINDLDKELELISPDPEDMDAWVSRAIDNNLSLSAAMVAVEIAQENVKIQRAGHYPTLDLIAAGGNSTSHGGSFGSDTDSESLSLQFNLPIYTGGRVTSQTRQALAELDQARDGLTETKRATEKVTRNSYLGILTDISLVRALQQAVISAQSAVDATEAGFEVGTRTIVDVLNVQRELYRAVTNFQKAQYAYLLDGLRLKQAVGSLSDGDLASVDQLLVVPTPELK